MLAAGAGPGTGPAASNILTVPVYLLDNSVRNIQIDINATVGDAVLAMGAALGIKNTAKLAPLFALCDCVDGINIGRPLSPAMPIAEVIASWPVPSPSVEDGGHPGAGADASSSAGGSQAEPRFVFQLKLFTEGLTIGCSIDPKVMYLQWVQVSNRWCSSSSRARPQTAWRRRHAGPRWIQACLAIRNAASYSTPDACAYCNSTVWEELNAQHFLAAAPSITLHLQAVYNVVCGFYPVTVDEAISLAALQVQTKFGTHNSEVHKSGFLLPALRGLIPASLQSRKSAEDWESLILSRHYVLNLEAQARPMAVYCAALASKEYYGCAFYTVKQRFSQVRDWAPANSCQGVCCCS